MTREPAMAEDVLSAYLDGECTDAERAWVEQALETSAELRAALAEVRAARDAVRALGPRDAPAEFWARLLASPDEPDAGRGLAGTATPIEAHRRRPARWVAAMAGAAAAAVIAAVALVPSERTVTPPVASFTNAHAVRASLQDDAVSSLAPVAVQAGFRR